MHEVPALKHLKYVTVMSQKKKKKVLQNLPHSQLISVIVLVSESPCSF